VKLIQVSRLRFAIVDFSLEFSASRSACIKWGVGGGGVVVGG
jgi:hypothetical protein